jgi:hypothetical protein
MLPVVDARGDLMNPQSNGRVGSKVDNLEINDAQLIFASGWQDLVAT